MKHTPGPWTYYKTGDPIGSYRVGTNKRDGHDTCTVQSVLNESNARLVAAAPELLEAVKELFGFINSGVLQFNEQGGAKNLPKACARAQAIIAKAEGK